MALQQEGTFRVPGGGNPSAHSGHRDGVQGLNSPKGRSEGMTPARKCAQALGCQKGNRSLICEQVTPPSP